MIDQMTGHMRNLIDSVFHEKIDEISKVTHWITWYCLMPCIDLFLAYERWQKYSKNDLLARVKNNSVENRRQVEIITLRQRY